jgi:hypothetical protein
MRSEDSWKPVLWPALLTLAVTLLRLAGELLGWSPALFSRAVGGGGSPIGIIWLVPAVGAYFGYQLSEAGPRSPARSFGWAVAALACLASSVALGFSLPIASPGQFLAIGLGSWAAIGLAWRGWPPLVTTLVRYGILARVPVALVVLVAILGDWRTHYDTPPPGLPEMGALARWVAIGVIPQLSLWMAVTVVLGFLAAVPAALVRRARDGRRSDGAASRT